MFVSQPIASCTLVQAVVNTAGQQVGASTATVLRQAAGSSHTHADRRSSAALQGHDVLGLQSSKFSTTDTFTTTHGFLIAAPPAGWNSTSTSHSGGSSNSSHGSRALQAAETPSTPVGWSGLLEISRCEGASSSG